MRARLAIALMAFLWISGVSAEPARFSVGIEEGEGHLLKLTYDPRPVGNRETFDKLRKGDKETIEQFNKHARFGKLGILETAKEMKVGEIDVAPGEHACGFNADAEGDFYFVIWSDEEARKSKVKIEEHKGAEIPNLTFMLAPSEEGHSLVALYGSYHARIPVTTVGAGEQEDAWEDVDAGGDGFSGRR
ncbi:MAG: hypothetical protein GHCLOJNM_01285 [bacterium]|nr:hypothetical protein [bacterium]